MEYKVRSALLPTPPPVRSRLRIFAIVGITVLAVALGGSIELWAQGVIALLAALLILCFPPRRVPGTLPMVVLFTFMLLALAAFLPAGWGPMPEWKRHP